MTKTLGIVSYSFLPRIGGCATLARVLAARLTAEGWNVFVIAPLVGETPDMGSWPDSVPVRWVKTPWARGYESHTDRAAFFAAFVRSISSQVADADVWLALDFHVGALSTVAGVRGRRPVAAVFGADPLFELNRFHRKNNRPGDGQGDPNPLLAALRAALRLGYGRLDKVIVFSDASRAAVARYTSAPATPIHLAYDDRLFDGTSGERSPVPELLVVSRLVPWKGVDRAIELFVRLRTEIKEARLVVAGDGPLAQSLAERYQSAPGVDLRFRVPAAEMPALYRHAWALVHPSEYETFGLVVVEAMASGTPVIAGRVPPLPDLIDHDRTGILVPPDDDEAWLAAMRRVVTDRSHADRLAAEAQAEARRRFHVDRMAELYDRLLTGLISSS